MNDETTKVKPIENPQGQHSDTLKAKWILECKDCRNTFAITELFISENCPLCSSSDIIKTDFKA